MSEEERLGIDFAKIWEERQKAVAVRAVEEGEKAGDGAKALHFDSNYATRYVGTGARMLIFTVCAGWCLGMAGVCVVHTVMDSKLRSAAHSVIYANTRRCERSRVAQYKELVTRYTRAYWRNPQFNTTRVMLALAAALVHGTYYWGRGNNYASAGEIQARCWSASSMLQGCAGGCDAQVLCAAGLERLQLQLYS
jgi:hypothetical protein